MFLHITIFLKRRSFSDKTFFSPKSAFNRTTVSTGPQFSVSFSIFIRSRISELWTRGAIAFWTFVSLNDFTDFVFNRFSACEFELFVVVCRSAKIKLYVNTTTNKRPIENITFLEHFPQKSNKHSDRVNSVIVEIYRVRLAFWVLTTIVEGLSRFSKPEITFVLIIFYTH